MMAFLLHFTSILPILMKSNGQLLRIKQLNFYNFKVELDLLMGPSSISIDPRIILHIEGSLMG